MSNEEWDTTTAYKFIMDRAAMRVIQHYLQDTLTFNNGSLLLWYHYLLTPVGEILRSKYYASKGDFTTARQLLAAIPNFYDLSPEEEDDLDDLQEIYYILDARGIENLTSGDFEELEEIASHPGHGAALARGILSHHDYHFGPEYYLPDEEEPYIYMPQAGNASIGDCHPVVYPNPSDGGNFYLFIPYGMDVIPDKFEILDLHGRIVLSTNVAMGTNLVYLESALQSGLYYYRLQNNRVSVTHGTIVVLRNKRLVTCA